MGIPTADLAGIAPIGMQMPGVVIPQAHSWQVVMQSQQKGHFHAA